MECSAFWRGMGAGLALGAVLGAVLMPRKKSMKTCVGRTMQHMGSAADEVWEDFVRAMR